MRRRSSPCTSTLEGHSAVCLLFLDVVLQLMSQLSAVTSAVRETVMSCDLALALSVKTFGPAGTRGLWCQSVLCCTFTLSYCLGLTPVVSFNRLVFYCPLLFYIIVYCPLRSPAVLLVFHCLPPLSSPVPFPLNCPSHSGLRAGREKFFFFSSEKSYLSLPVKHFALHTSLPRQLLFQPTLYD